MHINVNSEMIQDSCISLCTVRWLYLPNTMTMVMAFSKAFLVMISRGLRSNLSRLRMASPDRCN